MTESFMSKSFAKFTSLFIASVLFCSGMSATREQRYKYVMLSDFQDDSDRPHVYCTRKDNFPKRIGNSEKDEINVINLLIEKLNQSNTAADVVNCVITSFYQMRAKDSRCNYSKLLSNELLLNDNKRAKRGIELKLEEIERAAKLDRLYKTELSKSDDPNLEINQTMVSELKKGLDTLESDSYELAVDRSILKLEQYNLEDNTMRKSILNKIKDFFANILNFKSLIRFLEAGFLDSKDSKYRNMLFEHLGLKFLIEKQQLDESEMQQVLILALKEDKNLSNAFDDLDSIIRKIKKQNKLFYNQENKDVFLKEVLENLLKGLLNDIKRIYIKSEQNSVKRFLGWSSDESSKLRKVLNKSVKKCLLSKNITNFYY